MIIPIQPKDTFPKVSTQFRLDDGQVNPGIGANFQWVLLDADGYVSSVPTRYTLTPEEYAAWSNDTALAKQIAVKLGLTPL